MANKKLITILTPAYNREGFLLQNIRSIQAQKEKGFQHQHIIIDNASSDGTAAMVRKIAKQDPRIVYIRNSKNLGPGPALNIGLKKTLGHYIVPLDDDDLLPPQSLQMRFDFHKANPDAKWSYGYSLLIDENNTLLDPVKDLSLQRTVQHNALMCLLSYNFIMNGTVTHTYPALKKIKGWGELFCQDYELHLKLAAAKIEPIPLKSYVCLYRVHQNRVSNNSDINARHAEARQILLEQLNVTEDEIKNFKAKYYKA